MPKLFKKFLPLAFAVPLILSYFYWPPAYASISSCSASVSPHTIAPTTEILFQFQVTNSDASPIHWIKVIRPSSNFLIVSTFIDGWREATSVGEVTLTRGTLNPGSTLNFRIRARAENVQAPLENWVVLTSDDPGGANPFSCSGDLGTEISGQLPDYTPPSISSITTSNLTADSITIAWETDEPATSKINWGIDSSYGDSKEDPSLNTSHSLGLTNLSQDTVHHYQIESTDASGNIGYSEDNTFLTPLVTVTIIPGPSGSSPALQKKLKPTEKIPPAIKISTVLDKPFKEAPKITGEAADNVGIFSIEYSTDGGKNWLPADQVSGLGGKSVTFEFTPQNLEDGNYVLIARATDTSGNLATSNKVTLVIDRLPPLVGANVISIGPQILQPGGGGVLSTLAGIDQKVTLAAVGGPTNIDLVAKDQDKGKESGVFSLARSRETGLWSGILSFKKQGAYTLTANSIDGAGNKLQRQLPTIFVNGLPRVLQRSSNAPIKKAKVSLYYLEPESATWVVWDGAPYGQKNPQETSTDGSFKLFIPPGKYYLKTQAAGFQTLISEIFELDKPTPLTTGLNLEENFKIRLGAASFSLPAFSVKKITISAGTSKLPKSLKEISLVEKEVPLFSLPGTSGQEINSMSLRGKPTLLSFVATWPPASKEQLPALADLQRNKDINIVPVSTFENLAKVRVYTKIAGYDLNFLVDKDGQTIERFNLQSLPTHYFVNRKGIIKKVVVGVLSKEEILDSLGGL